MPLRAGSAQGWAGLKSLLAGVREPGTVLLALASALALAVAYQAQFLCNPWGYRGRMTRGLVIRGLEAV